MNNNSSSSISSSHGNKRRRRRPPNSFRASVSAAEERYLHQAIQNSKLDKHRRSGSLHDIPWAPVFYPTQQDFCGDPLQYVERIRPIAEAYGICKIVPPVGWNPAPQFGVATEDVTKKFATKHQLVHRLQEGISFGDGADYTFQDYQAMASQRTKAWKEMHYPHHDLLMKHAEALQQQQQQKKQKGDSKADEEQQLQGNDSETATSTTTTTPTPNNNNNSNTASSQCFIPENLERDFWDIVETHTKEVSVEYGNDVDTMTFGSGFPLSERDRAIHGTADPHKINEPEPPFGTTDYYKETWWNLNNIPNSPNSVLRHVKTGINGINVPWVYYGSLFTTFCWHNEDNYLYSVNYHHKGAPKQWYGVPGTKRAADGLERVFKSYLSMKMRDVPDLLHHITTFFCPRLLQNANVQVCKLLQHEGEFVITFPRAFHGGFSLGPNIGEAVNFATHNWIAHGADASERYRSFSRPAVFSHDRLTFTMAHHCLEEQKTYSTCKLLLDEVERVVEEELRLRQTLLQQGIRDVSDLISLPRNDLEQLDEKSANYDDRRLCHACKHVCFFAAVACECSQSKVSCLRHSHYMCRCPTERKYFMIWCKNEELLSTLECVRSHCASLKTPQDEEREEAAVTAAAAKAATAANPKEEELRKVAPGVERDLAMHKNDPIWIDPILRSSFTRTNLKRGDDFVEDSPPLSSTSSSKPDASRPLGATIDGAAFLEAEDDVEVVEVRGPNV